MNIRQQLLLDSYIAKPIAFFFNFIVRGLGEVLNINHDLNREFNTIAVCKFKGMGSIIQATPMLAAIKKKHPNVELIFISTKSNQTILEKIDLIDKIILVDDSSFFKFIISNIKSLLLLIKKRPELYFDLEIYSDYSTLFTLFSLSTNRVGFYLRSSSFRMGIYTHMMFFNPRIPISNVYIQLSRLIGCSIEDFQLYSLMKQVQQTAPSEKKYIVINPNSSDLRLERRWPQNNFIHLIKLILDAFPKLDVLLIGGKGIEEIYTQEICSQIDDDRVINTAGKTTIDEVINLIDSAKLMITNDTGPMHIAFSVQTTTVCLFGPCSPDQYGMSDFAHIIYKPVYCSPCIHDFEKAPCNGDNICMKLISVSEVYEKAAQLLSGQISEKLIQKRTKFLYQQNDNTFGKVKR